MNIYEKIDAIMRDVQYISKDDHVKFGTTDYKAVSEEKVTTTMRDELLKHKLVVFPVEQTARRDGQISHVDVKYRMVNTEKPDEYIEIVSCGDGADSQDKGSGKAMTYAYKYMWLRTFALPTGEDPDKIASAELDDKAQKAEEKAMHEKAAKEKAQLDEEARLAAEGAILCSVCGKPIKPIRADGKLYTVKDIADNTKNTYSKVMCWDCAAAAKKANNA